jgi:hypothetical protein
MAITAKYALLLDVEETLAMGLDLADDPTAKHTIPGSFGSLVATTTVPATKVISDTRSLTAGADTIDLTNMGGPYNTTVTFAALKVQLLKIKADATNSDPIVFDKGASNGYELFGDANGQITLDAGCEALFFFNESLADVSGSAKTIDVSSVDTNASYSIILVAG